MHVSVPTCQRDCQHKMAAVHQLDELWKVVDEPVGIRDEVLGENKHLPSAFSSLHSQIVLIEGGGRCGSYYIRRPYVSIYTVQEQD